MFYMLLNRMCASSFCFREQHWPACCNTTGFALIKSFARFPFVSFIAVELSDWGKRCLPSESRKLSPSDMCGDIGEE